ncbi:hypothetical protein [Pseudomonas syringae group genomosp. 3]|uniref:hypothetical protein n=1 Tax=Pseudomonas syringae group genomosp. 3 TaxID=251701 RepID=UPI00139640DA|nr:hypothetical protein [Pseudomonas syringae group genomosp. 3]MBF9243389.1 hypothetical protein [Pseudomonas syringae pv. tomato]
MGVWCDIWLHGHQYFQQKKRQHPYIRCYKSAIGSSDVATEVMATITLNWRRLTRSIKGGCSGNGSLSGSAGL